MDAAEGCFFAAYGFLVAALVDLAAAVCAHFEAGLDGYGNQSGEAFKQLLTQCLAFCGELEHFLLLGAHELNAVFNVALVLQLLQKRINQAGTDFLPESLFETVDNVVAMVWSFVQYGEYVETGEIMQKLVEAQILFLQKICLLKISLSVSKCVVTFAFLHCFFSRRYIF